MSRHSQPVRQEGNSLAVGVAAFLAPAQWTRQAGKRAVTVCRAGEESSSQTRPASRASTELS